MTNSLLDSQLKTPTGNQSLSNGSKRMYDLFQSQCWGHWNPHSKVYPPSCLHQSVTLPSFLCGHSHFDYHKMLSRDPGIGWRYVRGVGLLSVQTFKATEPPFSPPPSLSESMPQGLLQSQPKRITTFLKTYIAEIWLIHAGISFEDCWPRMEKWDLDQEECVTMCTSTYM